MERMNAGMVIFVGSAARFVTRHSPIAPRQAIIRVKLPLVVITAMAVKGVNKEA